ncbi:hypothetical protein IHE49_04890 [Rhodanobacter sp. 7MK24]|uniref:hypothetical protein n=1 Tax=Rhodanobacter sp. 7MK24 TaxID=2775922 RepID=UPI001787452B|nr:hypothetical protein [Rhodanobacter sp. 7MK24]MBD8879808.1 hypothetical protein [Rhodanobacter sp. 7MK24]
MKAPDCFLGRRKDADPLDAVIEAVRCDYASPGCWAALAVLARAKGLDVEEIFCDLNINTQQYARAIGIEAALDCDDTYAYQRTNQGKNYSPLVLLRGVEEIDRATQDIASCVRNWFTDPKMGPFVANLCDVVGDLHDNVWSHAESTGISMASKWKKPYSSGQEHVLEFALADAGAGFLAELRRAGIDRREGLSTHAEAINWCIVEGNSSKKKDLDFWAQALPPDAVGNPIGDMAYVKVKENNHLGLGLAKLVELVQRFHGQLWLASGDSYLTVDAAGNREMHQSVLGWSGVLLACRFETDKVAQAVAAGQQKEMDDLDRLLSTLLEDRS